MIMNFGSSRNPRTHQTPFGFLSIFLVFFQPYFSRLLLPPFIQIKYLYEALEFLYQCRDVFLCIIHVCQVHDFHDGKKVSIENMCVCV